MRTRYLFWGLWLLVLSPAVPWGFADEETASAILRRADEARGNLQGVTWKVSLVSEEQGRTNTLSLAVKARSFDVLAEIFYPPRQKGEQLLMVNRNMWFHKPGLSKPVPISQRQRLSGNAAYGDIASTNYAEDYTAAELPDETVGGEACFVFDLKAKDKKTTYDRIRYWVSKSRMVGLQAEYYTVSGKKFKWASMEYGNSVEVSGERRPFISAIMIRDALISDSRTTLTFSEPSVAAVPDHVFNLNLMQP